ncbi:ABC-2 type transport system permease protein [Peribacillus cavernae]|nr:ABC-2 type transport system permease protein [Peribacillus cavernae]
MGLIVNEWVKIFKRKTTYIMIGILALLILASSIVIVTTDNEQSPDNNWKTELQMQNREMEKSIESMPGEQNKELIRKDIAENEYRIEHNISPAEDYSAWSFIEDMMQLIDIVALLTIIVAAGMVASEFSWGTIKLLLIRPISRVKILLSKYVVVLLFSLAMLLLLFIISFVCGAIFFGLDNPSPYLAYADGKIVEQNFVIHLVTNYLLSSIGLLMFTTMAFMISAAFRSSSLAIGISIFLLLAGGTITTLLAAKFEWAKYLLFANVNLTQYFESVPMVEGMTLTFSVIMLFIYFIIFHVISFWVFVKRDVAA